MDARTDVWPSVRAVRDAGWQAGVRSDHGDDILAAVLRMEPEWSALPPETPPGAPPLRRCLEKTPPASPRHRGRRIELDDELDGSSGAEAPPEPRERTDGRARSVRARENESPGLSLAEPDRARAGARRRLPTSAPAADARTTTPRSCCRRGLRIWATEPSGRFALSPTGRRLALIGSDADGQTMLWVRPLETAVAQRLAGTEARHSVLVSRLPLCRVPGRWQAQEDRRRRWSGRHAL